MFSEDIGIDLGTANTLVYKRGKGIILSEPSVISFNNNTGDVVAVGEEARKMLGRTPRDITTKRPLLDGVIADYDSAAKMLKQYIKRIKSGWLFSTTRIIICHPVGITEVEKMAIEDAAAEVGAKKVYLVPEPFAAALGANLPIFDPCGSMIIDIGGGTTEIAVLSLGGIVTANSVRFAGDYIDKEIVQYVRKTYNIFIGERTAESIKMTIGNAYEGTAENKEMKVSGRNLLNGLPDTITLYEDEIRNAIMPSLIEISDAIHSTLEETPPELSADIISNGITVSGGGALIRGIDKLFKERLGVDFKIADNPLDCVAVGAGKSFDFLDVIENMTLSE